MRLRVRHHDRSRQPGMPKLNLGKIAEGLLGALAEFAQNDPKAKLERERQEKLTLVRRWSTSSEQEQLRESFDLIEESSTEAEHDKRTARADKMFKSLLTKAEFRSNEVNQRDREERQLFETGRLLKTTPDPEELVYSQNADLRGISKFDPLGWIPVPSRVPKLDSKTKQLRRDCTSSVSSRLKKIIGFAEELTPMVVPHFESHRGQTYLSGHVAVPAVLELDLPAAEEDINGMKRRRPARRGHFARLFSPRTRIPELRIDLKDTDRLPLALRRFLDEPDWPQLASKAGILDLSRYWDQMQTGGKPAAANDLTEILATLSGWGYPSKVVEKHYENLTPMMKDLSLEEKAARVAEGIDAERRRVEDEIRKVPTPPTDTANEDPGWPEVLKGAMVMALFGPMGSGKSTTAHFCLELLRDKGTPYLVLYPGMPRPPVPPWIRMVDDLEEVPPDAIILLDEASLVYHSRESATAAAKLMSKWIGLVRQRHQALIILGRLGSEIDKNLVSYSDAVGIKKPLEGQGAFERPALRGVLQEAEAAFRKVEGDARAFTWVWDRRSGEKKMVQNTMPTYWSEDLSEAFAKAPLGAVDNIPPRQNKRSPR